MKKLLSNMFFWCGISLFLSYKKEYGGYNHWIAEKIFRDKFWYMEISITYNIKFSYSKVYYDGYHNSLHIGVLRINYGT